MSLQQLEEALPALLDIRADGPRGVDWNFLAEETGVVFPADFVELAEAYPRFTVDEFLGLHIPTPGEEENFVRGMKGLLRNLEELRDSGMSHGNVPYPEPGGLVPWGDSCDGDVFFWRANGADPQSWTILVSGHNDDWCEFKGTLTEYLAGLVTGAVAPDGLPPDFPSATPDIEAD
ncbi:hypothetical protein OG698_20135 [Streptomyces sp. NBC_01003]|uniref:hypothetical protein n=1 Tax=Streptomyces sp. NBC_01003 TaxID=2903714 RepID=UPI003869E510|nr:hypothetical protein OG698_20135 [Streptomyces sp. NBC_01003]